MSKRTLYIIGGALLFVACLGFFTLAGGVLLFVGLRNGGVQASSDRTVPTLPEIDEILPEIEEIIPEVEQIVPELPSAGELPYAQSLSGLVVLEVDPGSPAAAAGLQAGDVLTALDGQPLDSDAALAAVLATRAPGQEVALTFQRDDETHSADVTLADKDGAAYLGVSVSDEGGWMHGMQGMTLEALTITSVTAGSPAEAAGLQPGDQITAVNGEQIGAGRALRALVQSLQPGAALTLTIVSGEQAARDVVVTLAENPDTPGLPYLGITFDPVIHFRQEITPGRDGEVDPDTDDGEFFHNWPFRRMQPDDSDGQPLSPQDVPGMFRHMRSALVVQSVEPGSPAETAGLAVGDFILAVDDASPSGTQTFLENIAARAPGDTLTLDVMSMAEMARKEITVTLSEDPANPGQGYLGVTLASLADLREHFMPRFNQPEDGEGDF